LTPSPPHTGDGAADASLRDSEQAATEDQDLQSPFTRGKQKTLPDASAVEGPGAQPNIRVAQIQAQSPAPSVRKPC